MEITDSEDKIKIAQLLIGFAKVIADRCRLDKIFSNAFNNCFETELTMQLFEKTIVTMAVMFADDMDNQIEYQNRLKNEIESDLMYLETHRREEYPYDNNKESRRFRN